MKRHILNPTKFKKMKTKLKQENYDNLYVLSDFDYTLTYAIKENGERAPLISSTQQVSQYLGKSYLEETHRLYNKYHPVQEDPTMSEEKKREVMKKWREEHHKLLIEKGLTKEIIKKLVEDSEVEFRKGVDEFLDLLQDKDIPLIVISAAGIGELIPIFFEKKNKNYSNIHFIINRFEWNEAGEAVGYKAPIVHMNKDQFTLKERPKIYQQAKNREDVLLLGDDVNDLDMVKGLDYGQLLSVGFLCYNVEVRQKKFEEHFDVVLEEGADFTFITDELFN